jgi:transcriptional regulator with XRE-family HTH domain
VFGAQAAQVTQAEADVFTRGVYAYMITTMDTAAMARKLRLGAGLSVRGLAESAHVSPSTIFRIEKGIMSPTIELLEDIFKATGQRLQLDATAESSYNILGLASSIQDDLDDSDATHIVRKAAEFAERFKKANKHSKKEMIAFAPPSLDQGKWDAFLGGLTEWLSLQAKIPTPNWANKKTRYLDHGEWITQMESMRAWEYAGTPASFQNRGVYIHQDSLVNV